MRILCVMQFVPRANGMGGEQRAWFLLNALVGLGEVHLVVVQPTRPAPSKAIDLPLLEQVAASVSIHAIPEWSRLSDLRPRVHRRIGGWLDYGRMGTPHTPRFSAAALERLADRLPFRDFDLVFAGRLPAALMVDGLIERGRLRAQQRIVDFDDILSEFFERESRTIGWSKPDRRLAKMIDVALIRREEDKVLAGWDGVAVCSEDDVGRLRNRAAKAKIAAVPNVVDRPMLAPATGTGQTILFVGNLRFGPNVQGLERFVDEAWPKVRAALPQARLQVVGLDPPAALRTKLAEAGAMLDANVPSVEPFYRDADLVVAPIFFGGGTRIKILEAMAYGRPVVATSIGAEGLGLRDGETGIVADTLEGFADAVITLLTQPGLRSSIASRAREWQQAMFGPPAIMDSIRQLVGEKEGGGLSRGVGSS